MPVIKPLEGPSEAPQQYKQPSRKGKKAWRKNVDVSEVEQGLEQVNEEVIRGGVISERKPDELFTVDLVGDSSIAKRLPSKHVEKRLKADEIIAQRSAVPAVRMRKRPGDNTTDGVLPAKRQRRTSYVTQKELVKLKQVADGHHESTIDIPDATYDVWDAAPAVVPKAPEGDDEEKQLSTFLPKPSAPPMAPRSLRQKPVSLAASGKAMPAVPRPKGGYSYNPTFPDYEARLTEASSKVVEAERKRLTEAEAEHLRLEAAARSAAEAEAAEARADLSEWDEDSAWEGFESGGEELSVKARRPERKTPAQRNRIRRRKEEERRARHEEAIKKKDAQARRVKEIAKMVAERERVAAALQKRTGTGEDDSGEDDGDDDNEDLRRKQLGRFRLPEKDLELVLPDELQDSLRLLKPEGNLLKDRYRSFLVRGKMESRRRIPYKKQAKTKLTEKWSYKDFRID